MTIASINRSSATKIAERLQYRFRQKLQVAERNQKARHPAKKKPRHIGGARGAELLGKSSLGTLY